MGALRVELLGGFRATVGSAPPLNLSPRKAQALLAFLAVQPAQSSSRDKLAALLWSELDIDRARSNLRQTLFSLRRSPELSSCLQSEGETVRLSSVEIDVAAFERFANEDTPDALEKAAGLFRGDFLDGFAIAEAPFEEWLTFERERLRASAIEVLTKLLFHQVKASANAKAIQTALQLLVCDPFQEAAHRTLMQLFAEQGRRAAALKQYQSCVDLLQRELGVEPEPETRYLYQAILQSRKTGATESEPRAAPRQLPTKPSPRSGEAHEVQIVGRDDELARLLQALDDASRSSGGVVALIGEAGIGKTRLAQEVARASARQGGRVLLGRCYESEQILPFGPWVNAIRGARIFDLPEASALDQIWHAELARLFPEIADAGPHRRSEATDYLRLFEAMARLLTAVALRQPLLLMFEDLHWADEMSVRLLAFIARRVPRWRVLVVFTARPEEVADVAALRQAMQELRNEQGIVEFNLSRLSRNDTQTLVRSLNQSGQERANENKVWNASEGNPFMIVESCRALQSGATTPTEDVPLSDRIRNLLTDRLDRLSVASRALAGIAAIIGRDFDFRVLQRASDLDETGAASAVEELIRRGVLRAAGERFQFVHDWTRRVADEQVRSPMRAIIHRKVGEAFENLDAGDLEPDYAALGFHYEQGEVWQKAAAHLRSAGLQAATRTAHRNAIGFFERALAALGRLPKSRSAVELAIDIRFDLRNSCAPQGQLIMSSLREAEAMAAQLSDKHRLARTLGYMTEQMFMVGDYRQAISIGERALALADDCGDIAIKVTTNRQVGRTYYALGDYEQATRRLLQLTKSLSGDLANERFDSPPIASVSARLYLAWCFGDRGKFADALATAHEALAIAEAADHPLSIVNGCLGLGTVHMEKGDIAGAIVALERTLSLIRDWDIATFLPLGASAMGAALVIAGRTAEAIPLLEQGVATAEAAGRIEGQSIRIAALAKSYAFAGKGKQAVELGLRALALARSHGERGREARVLGMLGEIQLRKPAGTSDQGEAYFREGLALAGELGMQPLVARCHLGLAETMERLGRAAEAKAHRTTATQLRQKLGMVAG